MLNEKTKREHARTSFGLLPQGEQKILNLEKATSSVLSVLLLLYGSMEGWNFYISAR